MACIVVTTCPMRSGLFLELVLPDRTRLRGVQWIVITGRLLSLTIRDHGSLGATGIRCSRPRRWIRGW